jgi:hypothetical protein
MDRQMRRTYFERLCDLRDDYGRLEADDITSVISIDAMIAWANSLFDRPVSPLIRMMEPGAKSA